MTRKKKKKGSQESVRARGDGGGGGSGIPSSDGEGSSVVVERAAAPSIRGGRKRARLRPPPTRDYLPSASSPRRFPSSSSSSSPPPPPSSRPPSAAALSLSAALRDLSNRKRLAEALRLYRDPSNNAIRDGHHGAAVVDCCSRCGDVAEGERVVDEMRKSGLHVSVQAKTALLKGYAHSGMMGRAAELFREMCTSKDKRNRPNVRTLNTLFRGCLWTAAGIVRRAETDGGSGGRRDDDCVVGGVATSEEAWRLSKSVGVAFDPSSYEYSVALLCQALRCEEAEERVAEMRRALGGDGGCGRGDVGGCGVCGEAAESVAAALLCLARACALLGKRERAKMHANGALRSIDAASSHEGGTASGAGKDGRGSGAATGGKRSWRKASGNANGEDVSRRSSSNALFRSHRLSEMRSESTSLLALCDNEGEGGLRPLEKSKHILARYLATRLLCFSGGGTTDLSAVRRDDGDGTHDAEDVSDCARRLMSSLWLSFGLSAAVRRSDSTSSEASAVLRKADCEAIVGAGIDPAGLSVLSDDGRVDFARVFAPPNADFAASSTLLGPIHIELGAGSGDWIRTQALAKPSENFVSIELRSDRVAQTFAKCMLVQSKDGRGDGNGPIGNLCCVGAECGSFLRRRVQEKTIATVYVNHPEPPTQTYGSSDGDISAVQQGSEPAHMLNSETLLAAIRCLESDGKGRLIIVTDNRWYAALICSTLERVVAQHDKLLTQIDLGGVGDYSCVDCAMARNSRFGRVTLFEGKPGEAVGHAVPQGTDDSGTSYFDRLWRTGAGAHAEMKARYIIAMRTYRKGDERSHCFSTAGGVRRGRFEARASGERKGKKKNKKRNAEAQQRRNERRLAKKRAAHGKAATAQS